MVYSVYKNLIVVKLRPAEIQYDGRKTPYDEKRRSPLYKDYVHIAGHLEVKMIASGL